MKKKLLVLSICVGMLAGVAGCGAGGGAPAGEAGASTAQAENSAASSSAASSGAASSGAAAQDGGKKYAYGEDPNISGTLTMWSWDIPGEQATEAALNKHFPNIHFEYMGIDSNDYLVKIQTTAASNEKLPDIIAADGDWRGKIYNLGILEYLDQAPYNLKGDDVFDYVLPLMSDADDHIVGIPSGAMAGLAYRTDMAEQWLGTSDPAELEAMLPDWESFIEVGKKVRADSGGKVYMLSGTDDAYTMLGFQNDIPYLTADRKLNLEASIGPAIKRLIDMRDAGINDVLNAFTPAWVNSFANQSVLFFPCSTWGVRFVVEANDPQGAADGLWRLMLPPEGSVNWGGSANCLSKDCAEENKEAGFAFLKFALLGKEMAKDRLDISWFVISKGVYDDPSEPELYSHPDAALGGTDIVDFFIRRAMPTVTIRKPTADDAVVGGAVTLSRHALETDPSLTYEQTMEMIAGEIVAQDATISK